MPQHPYQEIFAFGDGSERGTFFCASGVVELGAGQPRPLEIGGEIDAAVADMLERPEIGRR